MDEEGRLAPIEIPTRTAQHCAQCTAHGKIALLKGHKKICPFKDCKCVHCELVNNKRQIMAKQVKLKRLQEKNHGLMKQRRPRKSGKSRPTFVSKVESPPTSPDNKLLYLENGEFGDDANQEDPWRSASSDLNMEQFMDDRVKCAAIDHWTPVSPIRFPHINPLQLQPTSNFLQPRSPSVSMATNFLADPDILSLNHIQTQPVYYNYRLPGYAISLAQATQFQPFASDGLLQSMEVASTNDSGHPRSMDAAQTLLTLHTGDD